MIHFLIGIALIVGIITVIARFWEIWKPILKWAGITLVVLAVAGASAALIWQGVEGLEEQAQQRQQAVKLTYDRIATPAEAQLPEGWGFERLPPDMRPIEVPENRFEQYNPLAKGQPLRWIIARDTDGCFFRVRAGNSEHAHAIAQRDGKALHPNGMFDDLIYGCTDWGKPRVIGVKQ
jgi:hypothetical protein